MEKNFTKVANTGRKYEETYTFRVHGTKTMFREQLAQKPTDWVPKMNLISFQLGLLGNAVYPPKYYFEFKVLPDLTGFEVYHSDNLAQSAFKIYVSGITVSALADGSTLFRTPMTAVNRLPKIRVISPNKRDYHYSYHVSSVHTTYNNGISQVTVAANPHLHNWSDSANELKFDITVTQITQAQFEESSVAIRPSSESKPKPTFLLEQYFLSWRYSDVTVRCEEQFFPAHIFILSHNSPVFAKTFEHEFKEFKEKSVEIKDSYAYAVLEMLRYFYTGEAKHLNEVSIKLYELADRYMVDDLKALCTNSLVQGVNAENALKMYCYGREREISQLQLKAEHVLVANKDEIVKGMEDLQALLSGLPASTATDLFKLLWKNN